ncbi:MAG TPA: SDR family oxidoreductase [Bryobacteraceae bacterium]|nr:SDR family oxidoreductase [Bryobacteraceae bacterium]
MKLKPIHEQVAVVFGASSGIGRQTAIDFARRGARVVVAARSREGLDSLVKTIHDSGGKAIAKQADAADFEQVRAVAEEAVREFGHLDTWVHAAAISLYARFEDTDPEEFRRVIEVNLVGQAYGARAALPHLRREGRGALIHITSVESVLAMPLQSAYAASKHGAKGMLDALRRELEAEGVPISVTNVMPAGINTPLFNHARTKLGVKPTPMPPIYEASTVSDVILYAAEHPVAEIYAGGAAKAFATLQSAVPRLVDRVVARTAIPGQETDEAKPLGAPDNLYQPVGDHRVSGDFSAQARQVSVYNWLETHPLGGVILAGTAIGVVGGAVGWLATRKT